MRTIVFYICGMIIAGFGLLMIIPGLIDIYYGDTVTALNTFSASLISIIIGSLLFLTFHDNFDKIHKGEIFLITCMIWLVISAFSALPFYFNIAEFNYISAYFEAISALTTTGISAISSVDKMSQGLLLWRSLLQWIGGVGIVVMAIAILPILRVGGMQLFYTESSEKMGKSAPSMATIMYRICFTYFFFTIIFIFLLWAVEMSLFDAINYSFASISTGGGNVTHDNALGFFQNAGIYWLIACEMLIGALPSLFLFYLLFTKRKETFKNMQVNHYITYIFVIMVFMISYLWISSDKSLFMVITDVFFYVISFASTTGMVKDNYLELGSVVVGILFLATLIGGCTGSTSGGFKFFRLQIMLMVLRRYLNNMLHPHQVSVLKYNDKKIDDDIVTGVLVFLSAFIFTILVLTMLMIFAGTNSVTAFTSIISCIVNNGLGFGEMISDNGSFGAFSDANKLILAAAMLLGRLEFLTALVLFLPDTWKKN